MATDNGTTGTLFEGLLNKDPDVEKLAEIFSNKNISIVSPTVKGFLSNFNSKDNLENLNIPGCEINYESSLSDFQKSVGDLRSKLSSSSENSSESDYESIMMSSLTDSLTSFVIKVKEIRSSYLPIKSELGGANLDTGTKGELLNFSYGSTGIPISEMESYENAFMRMLGMPTDADIGDSSARIFYFSPEKINGNGKLIKKTAPLGVMRGNFNGEDSYANILQERQKTLDGGKGGRHFDFTEVCETTSVYVSKTEELAKVYAEALSGTPSAPEGNTANLPEKEKILAYHDPDQLFRFYYLKSVPLQDSYIYGCIVEPEKIVSKPFELGSSQKINGIKQKTSLLETIIRIRLDRITGNPGIYSSSESDSSSPQLNEPGNFDSDKITEVECFLIQKLKKILYLTSKKYILEIKSKEEADARKKTEIYKGSSDKSTKIISLKAEEKSKFESDIKKLEILKAKEDAILFLLKDTSSSANVGNSGSSYSSLDIQEGIIRTSSGFNDVLSGPLYSILSYRSQYLDGIIKELTELYDSIESRSSQSTPGVPDESGKVKNPGKSTYTYIGICKEDFIIYTIALLSLNQDYLIGLLPIENRKNLTNVLSQSILSGNKDPYGIAARITRSPTDGGYPSVLDSVNALGIIVAQLYEEYISYIRENKSEKSEVERLASAMANSGIVVP